MVLALQLKAEGGYLVLQPTQRCQIKKILKKMQKGEKNHNSTYIDNFLPAAIQFSLKFLQV